MKASLRVYFALLAAIACARVASPADDPPAAPPTPTQAPLMVVYDTYLGDGWQNWSWAKTELSVLLTGAARRPIRVEAGGWEALYLHHDAFSTRDFKKLGLLIQGTTPDGEVRVFSLTDGKPNNEGRLVKFGNQGWTQVVMPLAELAAEDRLIDAIWVQNASGEKRIKFFVTEIKFE